MTAEEIVQFQDKIKDTILPHAKNMTITQIESIINGVKEVDDKFKNMLLEQVLIIKNKYK